MIARRRRPFNWLHFVLTALFLFAGLLFLHSLRGDSASAADLAQADPAAAAPLTETSLLLLLGPVLAVSAAIERFWEAVFSWFERSARTTGRLLGVSGQMVNWVYEESERATEAINFLQAKLSKAEPGSAAYQEALSAFQQAERQLVEAEERISSLIKSDDYLAYKRSITLLGSLVIGVVVSMVSGLQIFAQAGFTMSAALDSFLTGLLIGAGPGPLHTFISTLQELRNTMAGLAALTRGNAVRSVLQGASAAAQGPQPAQAAPPLLGGSADGSFGAPSQPAAPAPTVINDMSMERSINRLLRP